MKTSKSTFSDALYIEVEETKKFHVSEEFLYRLTLGLVELSILTSGFIFTLVF
jgi:hypothetical protein